MITVIWSGKGFLVAVIVFGSSLIANLITNAMSGSDAYWKLHKWPLAVSLFASAALCWLLGQLLTKKKPEGQDAATQRHTLFFIPMVWWAPIIAVAGAIVLGMDLLKK